MPLFWFIKWNSIFTWSPFGISGDERWEIQKTFTGDAMRIQNEYKSILRRSITMNITWGEFEHIFTLFAYEISFIYCSSVMTNDQTSFCLSFNQFDWKEQYVYKSRKCLWLNTVFAFAIYESRLSQDWRVSGQIFEFMKKYFHQFIRTLRSKWKMRISSFPIRSLLQMHSNKNGTSQLNIISVCVSSNI